MIIQIFMWILSEMIEFFFLVNIGLFLIFFWIWQILSIDFVFLKSKWDLKFIREIWIPIFFFCDEEYIDLEILPKSDNCRVLGFIQKRITLFLNGFKHDQDGNKPGGQHQALNKSLSKQHSIRVKNATLRYFKVKESNITFNSY